jgi:hypothetical protein
MERYGKGMIESPVTPGDESVDAALRDELAGGDAVLASVGPIMRHILSGSHHALFADEIVARVRGMIGDMAGQLLDAGRPAEEIWATSSDVAELDALAAALVEIPGLVGHIHALALEWHLTERLQARLALDPALPPLLETLLTSNDATTSALAMSLLAAQARFAQAQRRMQLTLQELPADLLHGALLALRAVSDNEPRARAAEAQVRADYDEGRSRLGLIARLVTGMGDGAGMALSLTHAGVGIFATALGMGSGQDRDVILFSTSEGQTVRLALALRAAGLKQGAIKEQVLTLHPEVSLPGDWDRLSPDRAAEVLSVAVPSVSS